MEDCSIALASHSTFYILLDMDMLVTMIVLAITGL